jgi:hypothetical protein
LIDDWFDRLTAITSTSLTWLKIWRLVGTVEFYWSSVSSKVAMGIIHTFEACRALNIKVMSWLMPIWCGVKSTLIDMNSKDFNPLSNMVNEGLTSSSFSYKIFHYLPQVDWKQWSSEHV